MATRSAIGMRTVDGRIVAVYCHWDGYPSNNGRILQEHYTDGNKVAELIGLGQISSLRPEIGVKHAFSQFEAEMPAEEYEAAYGNMTTFYGRDRGEKDVEPRVFNDAMDFVDNFNAGEEYFYLFNGTEWLVNAYGNKSENGFPEFDRVEDVLEREDA